MEEIYWDGNKGIFIPETEFRQGKFFTLSEIVELRVKLKAQNNLINELLKEVSYNE